MTLGRVAGFVGTIAPVLGVGASALGDYRTALLAGRTRTDQLNAAYAALAPAQERVRSFGPPHTPARPAVGSGVVLDQPVEADPSRPLTFSLGRLSDSSWPGPLSASSVTIPVGEVLADLDHYYVGVDPRARTRCIDGRHDPQLDEGMLGPQVPGGAPGAALAYRLGVDKDDLTRGTFTSDAEMMIESYLRLGLAPGGHRDDDETGEGVGCGAIDGLQSVLDCMTNPRLVEDHKRLTKTILDVHFERDHYLRVMGAGLVLQSRSIGYFLGRGEILDLLERTAPGSVSMLRGRHREAFVVVNLVEGTTLSSNRFADEHAGAQAFGYDLWRSRQLATALFPLPSHQVDRERFIHARVMLTIATLMALTDGSLQVLIRLPDTDR